VNLGNSIFFLQQFSFPLTRNDLAQIYPSVTQDLLHQEANATVSFDRNTHHDGVVPEYDLLITQDGYELLTKCLPRDPDEVEKTIAEERSD
jgi:hypothetical protein